MKWWLKEREILKRTRRLISERVGSPEFYKKWERVKTETVGLAILLTRKDYEDHMMRLTPTMSPYVESEYSEKIFVCENLPDHISLQHKLSDWVIESKPNSNILPTLRCDAGFKRKDGLCTIACILILPNDPDFLKISFIHQEYINVRDPVCAEFAALFGGLNYCRKKGHYELLACCDSLGIPSGSKRSGRFFTEGELNEYGKPYEEQFHNLENVQKKDFDTLALRWDTRLHNRAADRLARYAYHDPEKATKQGIQDILRYEAKMGDKPRLAFYPNLKSISIAREYDLLQKNKRSIPYKKSRR